MLTFEAFHASAVTLVEVKALDGFEEYVRSAMEVFSKIPEDIREAQDEAYYAYFDPITSSDFYQELKIRLGDIQKYFIIEDTYIAMYEPETNAVVCLFDPENNITEESWKVGRWKEATEMEKEKLFYEEAPEDETFMERHLIEGDKEKNLEDCLTAALPIRNSEGRIYAFAMTELPMLGIVLNAALYTFLYLVMMFLFIIAVMIAVRIFMKRRIVNPVRKISDAANLYLQNKIEGKTERVFDHLEIHTRDELEDLGHVMEEMETSIAVYEADLMRATSEQERIQTELSLAAKIQSSLLPDRFPAFPDRKDFDIYAVMYPAKEVGGDFYDFFMVKEDLLALVIADVSGKGIPAALFMMASMIIIENLVSEGYSPAAVLEIANERICSRNESGMFVTAWLGILDLKSGVLTAANAGHEYPVLQHAGGEFELYKDKHSLALGALEGIKYVEYSLTLEPGSALFVYTDGAPEATDPDNCMYGTGRLVDLLNREKEKDLKGLLEAVWEDVNVFVREAPQFDDTTMLCVRFFGNDHE